MRRAGSEEELTMALSAYMRLHHPDVLYHFDFGSGTKLTIGQAVKQKLLNRRTWPDMFIAHSRLATESVPASAGLFLKLKRDGTRLKTPAGRWASSHIEEQADVHKKLRAQGFCAEFAVGFDEAVTYIEAFLGSITDKSEVF